MNSVTARKIKSKNTSIEKIIASELYKRGLRYRRNDPNIYGKPDFTFRKQKVAIFCDSEFWHGKKYSEGEKFKVNSNFWEAKIKRNIERDTEVNKRLRLEGWTLLRFWGKEIKENPCKCVDEVIKSLRG